MKHVLDVSSAQPANTLPWGKIRKGRPLLRGVIVKASESVSYRNPQAAAQAAGARSVGLELGFYHFARPGVGSGRAQADHFLSSLPWTRSTWRPFLDLEWNEHRLPGPPLVLWILDFCRRIESRAGITPGLYFSPSWWTENVVNKGGLNAAAIGYLERLPLWIAHYDALSPSLAAPWRSWTLWQHTDSWTAGMGGASKDGLPLEGQQVDDSYLGDHRALRLPLRVRARRLVGGRL